MAKFVFSYPVFPHAQTTEVRNWRLTEPKAQSKKSPDLCPPSPKGGIGKRVQKRGLKLSIGRISSRQPPLSANAFSKLLKTAHSFVARESCRHLDLRAPKEGGCDRGLIVFVSWFSWFLRFSWVLEILEFVEFSDEKGRVFKFQSRGFRGSCGFLGILELIVFKRGCVQICISWFPWFS